MSNKKFVIDRKLWDRGLGASKLLNKHGQMCCLGFAAKACGANDADILDKDTPADVSHVFKKRMPWLLHATGRDSHQSLNLMCANDNGETADVYKERRIKTTFAKHGWEVEFKG